MKRWILLLTAIAIFLSLTACTTPEEAPLPELKYDLAYDMGRYSFFSEIFDEKEAEEWDAMGSYTLLLNGFSTPVLVDMDGRNVQSVRAYGQTAQLGTDGELFQDDCPVSIKAGSNAVVVNISWDYDAKSYILTEDGLHSFLPENGISTRIIVNLLDGSLAYYRYWGEYVTSFEQWDTAPLDLCTSREQFLCETGSVEIVSGEVVLTAYKTVTVSDEYDLDTMFAEAKASGQYEAYETVDDLFAANNAKNEED